MRLIRLLSCVLLLTPILSYSQVVPGIPAGTVMGRASGAGSGPPVPLTTLPTASLPALTGGDCTTPAGSGVLTCTAVHLASPLPVAQGGTGSVNAAFSFPVDLTTLGIGTGALANQTTSPGKSTAVGDLAAAQASTAITITAFGYAACGGNATAALTGNANTCVGNASGGYLSGTATQNVLVGPASGWGTSTNNNTGQQNACIGYASCINMGSGIQNSASGYATLGGNAASTPLTGNFNTAEGATALQDLAGASSYNTATGELAGGHETLGYYNIFYGGDAGIACTTCSYDTLIGASPTADPILLTGNYDLSLGYDCEKYLASTSVNSEAILCLGSSPVLTITGGGTPSTSVATFAGSLSATGGINATSLNTISLASLSTGLLKNTTGTGQPSIAVAGTDYQAPITAYSQLPTIAANTVLGNSTGSTATPTALTDLSPLTSTIQGGSIPRLFSARAGDVYNVADYGAFVCDGATDNSTTINAAITAWRTAVNAGTDATLFFPKVGTGQCVITSTINGTGLRSNFTSINGNSVVLLCKATGIPCWDATGSRFVTYRDLIIKGDTTNIPSIGMQIVRQTSAIDCPENLFDAVRITGSFTFAAFYNMSCETNAFVKPEFINSNTGANAYAIVMDGDNHWNATSAFQTITLSTTTQQSFNENNFYSSVFKNSGGGHVMWLEGTTRHRYFSGYSLTTTGTTQPVVLYDEGQGSNLDLDIDIHFETNVTDIFLLSGSNATPTLTGFHWYDQSPQVTNSFLKLDTGVTGATILDGSIRAASTSFGGSGVKVFDSAAAWNFAGYVYIPAATNWVGTPASFVGTLCEAATCSLTDSTITANSLVTSPTINLTSTTSLVQFGGNTVLRYVADPGGGWSMFAGQSAGLNADVAGAQKAYLWCTGYQSCGGAGTGVTLPGQNIELTAYGWRSLSQMTSGQYNTGYGVSTLRTETTGNNNTALGLDTMELSSGGGSFNTAVGAVALQNGTAANSNTAVGNGAMQGTVSTQAPQNDVAVGVNTMSSSGLTSAAFDVAVGNTAMTHVTTAQNSACIGTNCLKALTTGNYNTTAGTASGDAITTGAHNTQVGGVTVTPLLTTGSGNSTFGYQVAQGVLSTGSNNLIMGTSSSCDVATGSDSNTIHICGGAGDVISSVGTATPSSSTTTIAGTLNASLSGHHAYKGSAPAVSACGTSPTIDANATDSSGTVTVGTVAAASCTVTFAVAYTTFNHCRITSQSTIASFAYSYTLSAITVTGTSLVGDKFDYDCDGS